MIEFARGVRPRLSLHAVVRARQPKKNMNDKKMTDAEYVKEMIPHHQMAVDMSKELLQTTTNPELKQFAENVIEKQTSEIKQLEKL